MSARLARAPTEPQAVIAGRAAAGPATNWLAAKSASWPVATGRTTWWNILAALHAALRGGDCDVRGSNLKVVSPAGMVTYPDMFVRCGPLADEAIECTDPVVVFAVLSPSTRSEDLVRKRWAYQAIPSLAHLVYVDAAQVEVEIATRAADGRWWSVFVSRLADQLPLKALRVDLRLADLYAGTRTSA